MADADISSGSALENIRNLDKELLQPAFDLLIPAHLAPSQQFWEGYNQEQKYIALRACLILWIVSDFKVFPREFQLRATVAIMTAQDSLVDVGTGYGKTLCMILPCLLDPLHVSIIFSPLKRLQVVQVLEFTRFGIKAIAINEDTPNDLDIWKDIREGKYTALLVQPEQLAMIDGHFPRLARTIQDRRFVKLIRRIHVDEAHFIYSAGTGHYGLPAFRDAWGKLGEFRIKIGKGIPVQALSGTQPPHIKKAIIKSLLFDEKNLCSLKLSSNRPNTIYATHPIVGNLSDFRNLDFLVPVAFPPGMRLPKTLVFHDSVDEAGNAALYIDHRLPLALQDKGVVRHYHGGMSKEYLTKVYEDFGKPDGGLDIPDIEAVVQYGITRDVPTSLQRGGRGGRTTSGEAIFLIMYEPWALDIKLDGLGVDTATDPDHPNVEKLTKFSTKPERTGVAMLQVVQNVDECIRGIFAGYLQDTSLDALIFTTPWCCDRHPGSGFHIRQYFKGRFLYQDDQKNLFYGDRDEPGRQAILPPSKRKRPAPKKARSTKDREALRLRVLAWRANAHRDDRLASVRPISFILDEKGIKALIRLHPADISNAAQLVRVLNETPEWESEWSKKILEVLQLYDHELNESRKQEAAQHKARQKRLKLDLDLAKFDQATKENNDRIQQEVLQRYQGNANTRGPVIPSSRPNPIPLSTLAIPLVQVNTDSNPLIDIANTTNPTNVRRSKRLQRL